MTSENKIIDFRTEALGTRVEHFFVIRSLDMQTKKDGSQYLRLELGNKFGRVPAVLWEGASALAEEFSEGSVVKIRGILSEYRGARQVTVEKMRPATPEDGVEMEDFLPGYPGDIGDLKKNLDGAIKGIENPFLKTLLTEIFGAEEIYERFCRAPAGKLWHHTYLGGLLHHVLSMVELAHTAAKIHPAVDRDLLTAGALLHDIGKIDELSVTGYIDYSDEGRLVGHITQGAILVNKFIERIPDFPDELRMRMLHMILCHQGAPENESPRVPMTLEGIMLHYIDELDSQANAFERIMEREAKPGRTWSDFVKLKNRYFYFGSAEE